MPGEASRKFSTAIASRRRARTGGRTGPELARARAVRNERVAPLGGGELAGAEGLGAPDVPRKPPRAGRAARPDARPEASRR